VFLVNDIYDPLPWHSTISRTRKLYLKVIFEEFFTKVLMICLDNDAFLETKGIFRLYKPKNNE
jgi:hypothetical protein